MLKAIPFMIIKTGHLCLSKFKKRLYKTVSKDRFHPRILKFKTRLRIIPILQEVQNNTIKKHLVNLDPLIITVITTINKKDNNSNLNQKSTAKVMHQINNVRLSTLHSIIMTPLTPAKQKDSMSPISPMEKRKEKVRFPSRITITLAKR